MSPKHALGVVLLCLALNAGATGLADPRGAADAPASPGSGIAAPPVNGLELDAPLAEFLAGFATEDAARSALDAAVASAPADPRALHLRSLIWSQQGDDAHALVDIDAALALAPDVVEYRVRRGMLLHALHRDDEAIPEFDRAVALGDRRDALLGRALTRMAMKRPELARGDIDALLALRPDDLQALQTRMDIDWQLQDYDAALHDTDRALALAPGDVRLLVKRSLARSVKRDYEGSLADARAAAARAPDDAYVVRRRARAARNCGLEEEARANFARAVQLAPDNPGFRYDFGQNLVDRRQFRAAMQQFDAGLRLAPQDAALHSARAGVEFRLGDDAAAIRDYERARALTDGGVPPGLGFGHALFFEARYVEAEKAYGEQIARDPKKAAAWEWRGLARMHLLDFGGASSDLHRADELKPDVATEFDLSVAALFDGRYDEAAAAMPAPVPSVLPAGDAAIWRYLALIHGGQGVRARETLVAVADAASVPLGTYGHVIDFLLERIDAATLDDLADRDASSTRLGFLCLATYAEGEDALLRGRVDDARTRYERALRVCPPANLPRIGADAQLHRIAAGEIATVRLGPRVEARTAARMPAAAASAVHADATTPTASQAPADQRQKAADGGADDFESLMAAGRLDAALDLADRGVAADPDSVQAHARRGWVLTRRRELDAAIAELDRAIALDPKRAQSYAQRGWARSLKGDDDGALSDQAHALKLDPTRADVLRNQRDALIRMLELEGALEVAQDAERAAPIASDERTVGELQFKLHRWADAEESLRHARSLNPDLAFVPLLMDLAHLRGGDDASMPELVRWTASHDTRDWPRPIIDVLLGRADRAALDQAIAAAETPEVRRGRQCEADYYLGEWLMARGRTTEAEPLFGRAAAQCPTGFVEWTGARAELQSWPQPQGPQGDD